MVVSKSSCPKDASDWYRYLFKTPFENDFPKIAVDSKALYVSANVFDFGTNQALSYIGAFDNRPGALCVGGTLELVAAYLKLMRATDLRDGDDSSNTE